MATAKLPDFLYIGAPKCASTWIFRTVQAHPQIFVPPAKDIFYFDRQYHRGLKWYRSFFSAAKPQHRRIGELSTSYLYSELAAERIQDTLPQAKLMACIRNPITRAWSHYIYKKRNAVTSADFETTWREDPTMVEWGLYSKHIALYQARYPATQFKVFIYDDLQKDAAEFKKSIYTFLEVDPDAENPVADRKVWAASRPRSFTIAALAKKGARLARNLGLANLVGRVKSSNVVSNVLYAPLEKGEQERMPMELWDKLASYYADDVTRVSQLLNRDVSHWLKRPA